MHVNESWLEDGLFEGEFKPDTRGLTDCYSDEERKKLFSILFEEHDKDADEGKISRIHISVGTGDKWRFSEDAEKYSKDLETHNYPINKFFLCDGYSLFEKDLDEMPLYINYEDYKIRAVAKWRLIFGGIKSD